MNAPIPSELKGIDIKILNPVQDCTMITLTSKKTTIGLDKIFPKTLVKINERYIPPVRRLESQPLVLATGSRSFYYIINQVGEIESRAATYLTF